MDHTYRTIWNGKRKNLALKSLAASLMLAFGSSVYALPTGGAVSAGGASIASSAGSMTVNQSSQNVAINWQSFSIGQAEAVRFVQPNSSSVALNRVLGSDPSSILGSLSANGKVFLVNPNGILFAKGAQVNVGGLVASTRNITDSDFMAGNYKFAGTGGGTVLNQGTINADGGYVALLGASVSNEGVISARLGTVALAAGNAMTLDVAGDGLLNVAVNQGALNALAQNGGLIRADGGQVLLTAMSAGTLLQSAVNNTGIIQAQTAENHNGTIRLLGDMQSGTVNVGGTLDASAPSGGNGGFIEASAAHVQFANDARITTAAATGLMGTFLIDPQDFTIQAGANISGAALSLLLTTSNVVITTNTGPTTIVAGAPPTETRNTATPGNGDIFVLEAVSWTGTPGTIPTTLTLNAARDVNIGRDSLGNIITTASITAVDGNVKVCCGRDVNLFASITTTRGSVLLSAGNDVNVNAAISTGLGNISLCAGHDVKLNGPLAALTLVDFATAPNRSLGLPDGLVLSAGSAANGPGVAGGGGSVIFAPGTPPAAITRAPVTIIYNPTSYTGVQPDFSGGTFFTLVGGSVVTQFMLVFPDVVDKIADGTTTATLAGFKSTLASGPVPIDVILDPPVITALADFDTPLSGIGKTVTFSGYTLTQNAIVAGGVSSNFALPVGCCAPLVGRTTGNIVAAAVPPGGGGPVPGAVAAALTPVVLPVFYPYTVLAGLNLNVGGITMPPVVVAELPPVEAAPQLSGFTDTPVIELPVPPVLPRKPDRN